MQGRGRGLGEYYLEKQVEKGGEEFYLEETFAYLLFSLTSSFPNQGYFRKSK